MKPQKQLRAQDVRTGLSVLLVIVLLAGGALFYWGLGLVRDYSVQVDHRLADADASAKQIQQLQVLQSQLHTSNSLVEKANQLFASPNTYQSQVSADIRTYADAAGLAISSTNFSDPAATGTHTITLTFKNPVSYAGLVAFLNNVEGNLPKLQVSSLSLAPADGNNAGKVQVSEIKIDISVR